MSPTVAAPSSSLHRSNNTSNNALKSSSDTTKKGNVEPRLPPWTAPKPKPAQAKTLSEPVSKPPKHASPSGPGSSAAAKTVAPTAKKRKRSSPFRIKVGCIVALRHRSTGNHVAVVSPTGDRQTILGRSSNSYAEVWADPMPGRDEGFALMGRRIRCCFPKSVVSDQKEKRASSRILEGEIVSLVDYQSQWSLQRARRRKRAPCDFVVELLVDRTSLTTMPFLKRTDEAVRTDTMSETEKKRLRYEEIIRGENKVMVQVTLADISRISNTADDKSDESEEDPVARWVVRKRVPLPLSRPKSAKSIKKGAEKNGLTPAAETKKVGEAMESTTTDGPKNGGEKKEPTPAGGTENGGEETGSMPADAPKNGGEKNGLTKSEGSQAKKRPPAPSSSDKPAKRRKTDGKKSASVTKYLGNGNDSPAQQERNWRWLAGRYYDMQKFDGPYDDNSFSDIVSSGLVGEVLRVTPSAASASSATLATVTLRRLIIPEQTRSGRMANHGPFDIFDDSDVFMGDERGTTPNGDDLAIAASKQKFCTFEVPVEELVIISRRFERRFGPDCGTEKPCGFPLIRHSYSSRSDMFVPLIQPDNVSEADTNDNLKVCHRCRKAMPLSKMKPCLTNVCGQRKRGIGGDSAEGNWWCAKCLSVLESMSVIPSGRNEEELAPPCCDGYCDCRSCSIHGAAGNETSFAKFAQEIVIESDGNVDTLPVDSRFTSTCLVVRDMRQADFHFPKAFLELSSLPIPSDKPLSQVKKRVSAKRKKNSETRKSAGKAADTGKSKGKQSKSHVPLDSNNAKDYSIEVECVFKPTCCRLLPYDQKTKRFSGVPKQQITRQCGEDVTGGRELQRRRAHGGDARQNVRTRGIAPDRDEKKSTSRAARANQRRMMKDVVAFGATGLGLDALAGREQQLRFDKSLIHAWGVFADEDINTGEMIVEYRGELIGNAVAEKREKEYEEAKIGSDYMFRIDAHLVCDATKQGNVARFINASCNPNCYTQIITLNGVKRIVIYAKRDIQAGEELCYDYKFPLEFDESRRIKCYCGAPDCRGFMNWDKKYVALPAPLGNSPGLSIGRKAL